MEKALELDSTLVNALQLKGWYILAYELDFVNSKFYFEKINFP